jgi:hypothetical protein
MATPNQSLVQSGVLVRTEGTFNMMTNDERLEKQAQRDAEEAYARACEKQHKN